MPSLLTYGPFTALPSSTFHEALDEPEVPPQHADTMEKEGERRSSAGNKRRCPPKPARAHGDIEPLEISLDMTITSAIPQPLPTGIHSGSRRHTSGVPAGCECPHPFPISLLVVGKETKLLSSISLCSDSPQPLFFAFTTQAEVPAMTTTC